MSEGGLGASRAGLPRLLDIVASALALVALAPLLLLSGLAVYASSPGPVIFRQERVGLRGRRFIFLKFRSMSVGSAGPGVTAAGDARVTGIGRRLRRLKLDELPQLWNVLVGDMSLVGPRPEVPQYVNLDDPRWREVLSVRPGITDPVTLWLRDEETLLSRDGGDPEAFYRDVLQPKKLAGYVRYLRRRSALSDCSVLLRTVAAVLMPRWGREADPEGPEWLEKTGSSQSRNS